MADTVETAPRCPETGAAMYRDTRPMTITYKGESAQVDMPGWYCDESDESIHDGADMKVSDRALTELKAKDVEEMTASGVIAGGMIPKTETALDAVRSGVRACTIVDGRVQNAVLLELFTDHGAGSMIRA